MREGRVTVYRFRFYDITTDGYRISRRWGTSEAIQAIKSAEIMCETGIEVHASALQSDMEGMTERGFEPSSVLPGGFQTRFTSAPS